MFKNTKEMKSRDLTVTLDYEEYIVRQNELFGGYQTRYKFPNGYGASVIYHEGSYGLELAVLDPEGYLTYDTSITDDVVGYIENEEELNKLLKQIKEINN